MKSDFFRFKKLHYKLFTILVFLMILPTIALTFANSIIVENLLTERLEQGAESYIIQTADQLEQLQTEFKMTASLFLSNYRLAGLLDMNTDDINKQIASADVLRNYLANTHYINPDFKVRIILPNSHFLTSYGFPVETNILFISRLFTKKELGKSFHIRQDNDTYWLQMNVPFGGKTNIQNTGSLVVEISFEKLRNIMKDENSDEVYFSLVDSNENFLFQSPNGKIFNQLTMHKVMEHISNKGASPFQIETAKEFTIFYRSIGTEWVLIGEVLKSKWLAPLVKVQRWALVIMTVFIIIALLVAVKVAKDFTSPIQYLASLLSRKKKQGTDIYFYIPQSKRIDEVRHLYDGIRDLLQEIKHEQVQKKEYQLRMLQYQINPHFLYNTLDSIQWMAIEHKAKDIVEMLKNLSYFMRHGLNNKDLVTIEEEIKHLRSYLNLQKIRYNDMFDVKINISQEILKQHITKISIQPLVENAIRYGMNRQAKGDQIIIEGNRSGPRQLTISIQDNGQDLDIEKVKDLLLNSNMQGVGHFGLRNVNERIKLYFGEQYGIKIIKLGDGKGSVFNIHLPYHEELEYNKFTQ